MHKIYLTALGALLCLLLLLLPIKSALADGTETLGVPAGITLATGTGIAAAGIGMATQPGTITITVPTGAIVKQVLLYWEGQMSTNSQGDDTIRVNGTTDVTGSLIGGPTFFFSGAYSSAFRADITDLNVITPGFNTVTLDNLTYSKIANGAGILVIYDEGTTPAVIDLRDGVDLAYYAFPEPRQNTITQTFTFPASPMTRMAHIIIFASSVESTASGADNRPDSVEIIVDGAKTIIPNPLNSNDGDEWDTLELQIEIPAGATTMSMRLFSRDDANTNFNPASMTWIGAGFAIIPPASTIDIEKATNGEDADLPTGPQILVGEPVTWTYVVTNMGEVTLNNIVVTDDQIGVINCPQTTLNAAASMTCIATGTAIAGQYANMSTVVGTPVNSSTVVTDTDPSHYVGIPPASIGDLVFRDTNNNGIQDSGEPVVDGVTVELYNTNNTLVGTTVTSGGGLYLFNKLAPGDYYLRFINTVSNDSCTIPNVGDDASDSDGVPSGADPRGPTCTTTPTTLSPGETDLTWDLGLVSAPTSIILEKATNGEDADLPTGPQILVGEPVTWTYVVTNMDEVTLNNIVVTDDQIGVINCPQTTLNAGASMTCIATGTAIAGQYANMSTVVGTPVNSSTVVTDTDPSHYVGIPPASIGDLVFRDTNNNGIQDSGEPVVDGVTVELYNTNNTLVGTTVTSGGGLYLFNKLAPGDYYLRFINTVSNDSCTIPNVGDDASDSDGVPSGTDPRGPTCTTTPTTLSPGETDLTWDLGLVSAPASIILEKATNGEDADLPTGPQIRVGDTVTWSYEVTNTGLITLTNITLTDDQLGDISCPQSILVPGAGMVCTTTGTATEGQYANLGTVVGTPVNSSTVVTDTDPSHYSGYRPAAVGNFVFGDINPTGITPQDIAAGNGIQDGVDRETGIAGIIVKLYASDGTLISTTVTADDGSYLFDNLVPGDYYLVFVNPGLGIWTDPNVGSNDSVDSDAATPATDPDGVALQTAEFTLSSGETDLTWDAGLIGLSGSASAAVGNRVWVDKNLNGIQDDGEVGFPGATVQLYSSDGTLLKEVQTNDQGIYTFENLEPGDYFIKFTPPSNYNLTKQKVGSDDEVDSDIDPITGRTISFTLIAFETNPRFDLGIFSPSSLTPDTEPLPLHIYLPVIQLSITTD